MAEITLAQALNKAINEAVQLPVAQRPPCPPGRFSPMVTVCWRPSSCA